MTIAFNLSGQLPIGWRRHNHTIVIQIVNLTVVSKDSEFYLLKKINPICVFKVIYSQIIHYYVMLHKIMQVPKQSYLKVTKSE